jgi:hypothetical protein
MLRSVTVRYARALQVGRAPCKRHLVLSHRSHSRERHVPFASTLFPLLLDGVRKNFGTRSTLPGTERNWAQSSATYALLPLRLACRAGSSAPHPSESRRPPCASGPFLGAFLFCAPGLPVGSSAQPPGYALAWQRYNSLPSALGNSVRLFHDGFLLEALFVVQLGFEAVHLLRERGALVDGSRRLLSPKEDMPPRLVAAAAKKHPSATRNKYSEKLPYVRSS